MKFFKLGFPQDSIYGIGYPDNNFTIPNSGRIDDWKPISFHLKDGTFSDYQGSNPACRLCSGKFKSIIDRTMSLSDELQWLPVSLVDAQGEQRAYFILHFPSSYDVLDRGKSIIVDEHHIVKPVFSLKKIGDHKVFNYNPDNFLGFVISEDIKTALEKDSLTNIVFSKAPTVA